MMTPFKLSILRARSTAHGTPGILQSSAEFACSTLELPWNDNRRGVSCIVPDTYLAWLWYSPTLKRTVVRLENKNGRFDCLLHNANWAGLDEGDETQIHGCTAIGQGFGELQNHLGHMQFAILNSGRTMDALVEHIKGYVPVGGKFEVDYSWGKGCAPSTEEA
jgi:hypothetical protein